MWKSLPYWICNQHVPQPHNYFILWCNGEKSMVVLMRKLKYGLGRAFKRKEDILPESKPACAVFSSIALRSWTFVVLHALGWATSHLEAPSSSQTGLLLKQTSPPGLSTLPLFLLLTAKSVFREAVRCPAAHGLLTKMSPIHFLKLRARSPFAHKHTVWLYTDHHQQILSSPPLCFLI